MTQATLNQWITVGGIPYPEYRYEPELEPEQKITIEFNVKSERDVPSPRFTYLSQVAFIAEPTIPLTIIAIRFNATMSSVTEDFELPPSWLYGIQKNNEIQWFDEEELIRFNCASNHYDEI